MIETQHRPRYLANNPNLDGPAPVVDAEAALKAAALAKKDGKREARLRRRTERLRRAGQPPTISRPAPELVSHMVGPVSDPVQPEVIRVATDPGLRRMALVQTAQAFSELWELAGVPPQERETLFSRVVNPPTRREAAYSIQAARELGGRARELPIFAGSGNGNRRG